MGTAFHLNLQIFREWQGGPCSTSDEFLDKRMFRTDL